MDLSGTSVLLGEKPKPKPKKRHTFDKRVAPSPTPPVDAWAWHDGGCDEADATPTPRSRISLERTAALLGLSRTRSDLGLSRARPDPWVVKDRASPFTRQSRSSPTKQQKRYPSPPTPDVLSSSLPVEPSRSTVVEAASPKEPVEADELRLELAAAHSQIEQLELHLETLHGRATAAKLASEEAQQRGTPWKQAQERRFFLASRGAATRADYAGEDMQLLLEQAILASRRRVASALDEAARVRAESEKADVDAQTSLELAFAGCVQTTTAEHQARMATRKLMNRTNTIAGRLRHALLRLEDEATAAQSTHAADMRSQAARLLAERDAVLATFATALHESEYDGTVSISGLLAQLRRLEETRSSEVASRDATIGRLQAALEQTEERLRREHEGRVRERERLSMHVRTLLAEVGTLEAALAASEPKHFVDVACLTGALHHEEGQRWGELEEQRDALAAAEDQTRRQAEWYERKLKGVRKEHAERVTTMRASIREHEDAKVAVSTRLESAIKKLETDKEIESSAYIKRVERLSAEIERLRCGTATGKRKAYFNKIKKGLAGAMGRALDSEDAGAGGEESDKLEGVPMYARHLAAKLGDGKLLSVEELATLKAAAQGPVPR